MTPQFLSKRCSLTCIGHIAIPPFIGQTALDAQPWTPALGLKRNGTTWSDKSEEFSSCIFCYFLVNLLAISLEMDNWFSGRNEQKSLRRSLGNLVIQGSDRHREALCWKQMTIGNGTSNQPININQPGDHCDFFLWHRWQMVTAVELATSRSFSGAPWGANLDLGAAFWYLEPWKGGRCFSQCKHATIGKAVGSNASAEDCFGAFKQSCVELTRMRESRYVSCN